MRLRSQTTATTPSDRQRTTIGIGEEVTVSVEGLCNGTIVDLDIVNMGAVGNIVTSLPFTQLHLSLECALDLHLVKLSLLLLF